MSEHVARKWATRLHLRIASPDSAGCTEWTGYVLRDPRNGAGGYGRLTVPRVIQRELGLLRYEYAHRAVYALCYGPIPAGMTVDHICFNRKCCNPAHMQLLSKADNAGRKKRDFLGLVIPTSGAPSTPAEVIRAMGCRMEKNVSKSVALRLFLDRAVSARQAALLAGVTRQTIYTWAKSSPAMNGKGPRSSKRGPTTNPEGSVTDGSDESDSTETSLTKDTGGK